MELRRQLHSAAGGSVPRQSARVQGHSAQGQPPHTGHRGAVALAGVVILVLLQASRAPRSTPPRGPDELAWPEVGGRGLGRPASGHRAGLLRKRAGVHTRAAARAVPADRRQERHAKSRQRAKQARTPPESAGGFVASSPGRSSPTPCTCSRAAYWRTPRSAAWSGRSASVRACQPATAKQRTSYSLEQDATSQGRREGSELSEPCATSILTPQWGQ
jgi:hypothetical protein